jgi:hypothetical protein
MTTPLAERVMAVPASGRYSREPVGVMRMWATSGSALVSGVTKEDIFERTRAFAMDKLHYDTMAAACLDFNARMITTAVEAAGRKCVSNLDEGRRLYTITETVPESQLKKAHKAVVDSRKLKRMLAKLREQGAQLSNIKRSLPQGYKVGCLLCVTPSPRCPHPYFYRSRGKHLTPPTIDAADQVRAGTRRQRRRPRGGGPRVGDPGPSVRPRVQVRVGRGHGRAVAATQTCRRRKQRRPRCGS